MPASCFNSGRFSRLRIGRRRFGFQARGGEAAFTFLEVVATMTLITILGIIVTGGFLMAQKVSSAGRVRTQARVILQRNIDLALNIPFTSANIPPNLALTTEGPDVPGIRFNEPGQPIPPQGKEGEVPLLIRADGTTLLTGTLWRSAKLLTNPDNAVVHRVTFTITYSYHGAEPISLTTLRARDDQ